jgi:quercetin dioxygenase-like cupin family protein
VSRTRRLDVTATPRGARLAAVAVLVLLAYTGAAAQDPAVVNAKTIKVKLENDRVRVLEATLQPGDKEQVHAHPASIIYVVSGGKIRNHAADGTTSEATYAAGDTVYREPLTHWAENIGTTTIHLMVIELKK